MIFVLANDTLYGKVMKEGEQWHFLRSNMTQISLQEVSFHDFDEPLQQEIVEFVLVMT